MMECERKPRIIIRKPRIIVQGGMYTDLECGGAQLQEEFMDALKGAARNGYDVLRVRYCKLYRVIISWSKFPLNLFILPV
jgi:hypothetical protein